MRITLGQIEDPLARFIVTNEDGSRFIPDAKVSLTFEDGAVLLSKRTDQGGNVAFGERELIDASRAALAAGAAPTNPSVVWYTAEAPGYALQDGIFFDYDKPKTGQLGKIYEISLQPAEVAAKPAAVHPLVPVAIVAAGLALTAYLSPR